MNNFGSIERFILTNIDLPFRLALQLKNQTLLVHDHTQLLARKVFTDDIDFAKAKSMTYFLRVLVKLLVTPLFCLCYSLRKIGIKVNCGKARNTLDSWYSQLKAPGRQLLKAFKSIII